jgi:hypothetical protein
MPTVLPQTPISSSQRNNINIKLDYGFLSFLSEFIGTQDLFRLN